MEIRTCEQYVLAELDRLKTENELYELDKKRLYDAIEELRRPTGVLDSYVMEYGRARLFDDLTYSGTDVRDEDGLPIPFRTWCEERVRELGRPGWLGVAEFVEYFEPEFREQYDAAVASSAAAEAMGGAR